MGEESGILSAMLLGDTREGETAVGAPKGRRLDSIEPCGDDERDGDSGEPSGRLVKSLSVSGR